MRDSFATGVLRALSLPVAFAIVLASACTQTAKAAAVVQGKVVQDQVRQLPPCDSPAAHAAVPSEQTPGHIQ